MFTPELLHPKVVHFVIALLPTAVLLDIIGFIKNDSRYHFAAFLNWILASLGALAAVSAGLLAEESVPETGAVQKILELHETIGFIVLGIVLVLTLWRIILKRWFPRRAGVPYLVAGIIGIGLMVTGAHFGGEMVYRYGVGVKAAEIVNTELEDSTIDTDSDRNAAVDENTLHQQ